MSTEQKLESYLEQLNKSLDQIPISDRADIITEIKSHILEAQERDPSQSLSSILASLGEPEAVASKYLLDRGLSPKKPSKTPMVKWLVIGFLGTLSLFILSIVMVIWKFTPLISIDGERGQVKILGGAIQIKDGDEPEDKDKENNTIYRNRTFTKSEEKSMKGTRVFKLNFTNGTAVVNASENDRFGWSCKYHEKQYTPSKTQENDSFTLDVSDSKKSDCEIKLPQGMSIEIHGTNGRVSLNKLKSSAKVRLGNGKIDIAPEAKVDYAYDLKISNGSIDTFTSSKVKNAYLVDVDLVNGKISKN